MRFLSKILLALSLVALLASPTLAAKAGNGNGSGKSESSSNNGKGKGGGNNGGGNGGGNNGNGNGGGNGGGDDGNNGNGGNNGNSNGNGNANSNAPVSSDAIVAVPDDQQVVQNAVRARRALPLEAITAVVAGDTNGRILDVQLVTFKGIYLYDVTVLERDGVLHKLYYNARSGVRVRTK